MENMSAAIDALGSYDVELTRKALAFLVRGGFDSAVKYIMPLTVHPDVAIRFFAKKAVRILRTRQKAVSQGSSPVCSVDSSSISSVESASSISNTSASSTFNASSSVASNEVASPSSNESGADIKSNVSRDNTVIIADNENSNSSGSVTASFSKGHSTARKHHTIPAYRRAVVII